MVQHSGKIVGEMLIQWHCMVQHSGKIVGEMLIQWHCMVQHSGKIVGEMLIQWHCMVQHSGKIVGDVDTVALMVQFRKDCWRNVDTVALHNADRSGGKKHLPFLFYMHSCGLANQFVSWNVSVPRSRLGAALWHPGTIQTLAGKDVVWHTSPAQMLAGKAVVWHPSRV